LFWRGPFFSGSLAAAPGDRRANGMIDFINLSALIIVPATLLCYKDFS
jgi:hypothetical protein